jgi:hypothetical protein
MLENIAEKEIMKNGYSIYTKIGYLWITPI